MTSGYLTIITGPMYAGKSEELQRQIRRMELAGKKSLIIKHVIDTRYGHPTDCCTHNLRIMPALPIQSLWDVKQQCTQVDVIGIDEGQFFPEIVEFVDDLVDNHDKIVIVAALDGTYEGKPFGRIGELVSHCEHFIKLSAICRNCGRDASFTIRRPEFTDCVGVVEVVGGNELYESVCRSCRKLKKTI